MSHDVFDRRPLLPAASGSRSPVAAPWRWFIVLFLVSWPGARAAEAPVAHGEATPPPQFAVQEYRVLGNTTLPARDIEALLYPLLGNDKQLSDVEEARAALEKLYHERGYATVFVDVPPQDVAEGIVRLHVTEGRLHARRIAGARFFSERAIIAALPATTVGSVPNVPLLQQQLSALNSQTGDRSVVPVLKAGPFPGTMDLELKVTDSLPLHGSFLLNNDYTVDTESLRATVGLSYSNLFAALDSINVQYQDSPQKPGEVGVVNASYSSRPVMENLRVLASFTNSNSNVSAVGGGTLGVLGKGQIYSLRLNYALPSTPQSLQSLSFGLDYKHFRDAVTVGGGSQLVTPISYNNVTASYVGSWSTKPLDAAASFAVNFGPRGLPNNSDTFENKRYLARANYFYVRWDDSLTAHLPAELQFYVRIAGQLAQEPLISNENFAVGGADGVRGYLAAEELGDLGIKGTVQLQSPTWSLRVPKLVNAFGFFDIGHTHVLDALSNQPDHANLRSVGVGLNLLPGHAITGSLSWADPLANGSYTRAHKSRVLFSLQGTF